MGVNTMTTFLASPAALPRLCEGPPDVPVFKLEVTDCRDDYCTSEGDGLWICPFIEFIESKVAERAHISHFSFSQVDAFDAQLFEEIESTHVRAMVVEFINAHYESWFKNDVDLPDYDRERDDCRTYCEECESGWQEIHGEYDGPLAEDVPPDENENEQNISVEERQARHNRNLERGHEREIRRAAQEQAENEVIDRDFNCDNDCDGFCDYLNDHYRDAFTANTAALRRRWDKFLADKGEKNFPPLIIAK
jgi:hypothetical protein